MALPEHTNLYYGVEPPPGAAVPDLEEVVNRICAGSKSRGGIAYPPEAPVCWIKYGYSVTWNEVCAQTMAYQGLRQLGSSARAPATYYAIQCGHLFSTYIVMEYIPGKTAGECLRSLEESADTTSIYKPIGLAVGDLHRIPVPVGSRPACVSGDYLRHAIFDEGDAEIHYENAQHLEDHLNALLRESNRWGQLCGLAREPMVFCQSDLFAENFMFDPEGRVVCIDFSDASIVPSSLAKFSVILDNSRLPIKEWVYVPTTGPIDNIGALHNIRGHLIMTNCSLGDLGRSLPLGDDETQSRLQRTIQRTGGADYQGVEESENNQQVTNREAEESLRM